MIAFSQLLEALIFSPRRTVKLAHLVHWLKHTPDPDRGYGLAALTGDLSFKSVKASLVRELAQSVSDETLFAASYDFVGDLAETTALLWPEPDRVNSDIPTLGDVVMTLQHASRSQAADWMRGWLSSMDGRTRWALLKLATGGLRVGVSARLARVALADAYDKDVADIEELWPLFEPPYTALFDWLEGRAERPSSEGKAVFRPVMLAHPLDADEVETLDFEQFQIEWKWDGARVQLVSADEGVRLFSRSGDDISAAFPEMVAPLSWQGTLDGELLAGRPTQMGSFNDLQQRLNRKKPSKKLIAEQPVFMRCYDLLIEGQRDWRQEPLAARRTQLENIMADIAGDHLDMSQLLDGSAAEIAAFRDSCRSPEAHLTDLIEGVMLKRKDSVYQAGRVKGQWFKWKRDPLSADVVMMYAQRGHGKRSSFFSDFTFGAWMTADDGTCQLVPVGKAYSGFSDLELKKLDKFVRDNTIQKFGPVREVEKRLVVELAFDSIHRSTRHKSGLAMRFPRFHAIRWDKAPEEAETIEMLEKWVL